MCIRVVVTNLQKVVEPITIGMQVVARVNFIALHPRLVVGWITIGIPDLALVFIPAPVVAPSLQVVVG